MNMERNEWDGSPDGAGLADAGGPARARRRWIIAGIVAILAVLALVVVLRGHKKTADSAPALPSVTYIVPGRQAVTNLVSATGNIAARREMPVGIAGEGGMVNAVLVEPGDWVKAGQVLATVDRRVQAAQTSQMASSIQMADADARLAQANLDRAQKLVGRGFISQADIDAKVATRDSMVAKAKMTRAQFGEMNARMGRLDVRAPTDGLVLTRAVEAGQVVSAGGPALFTIAEHGEMEMRARVAEGDLAHLAVGRPAQVTPVGTSARFAGQIWQLAPVIDPTTRQGIARIALGYNPAIRPGGFAAARIESGAVDAPLLPESAVQSDAKGNFVFVIGPDDKVARRDVKTGQVSSQGIAILSGLGGDEHVVFAAGAFLNPGDKVIPVRAPARG